MGHGANFVAVITYPLSFAKLSFNLVNLESNTSSENKTKISVLGNARRFKSRVDVTINGMQLIMTTKSSGYQITLNNMGL